MPATLESEKTVSKRKVLLVEDHPMFRERLAHLINKDLDMMVCGEADNIRDAMLLVRSENPDIAIVDISLKGSSGLELIKDLKAFGINLPVLVLSMHDENLYAGRVLRAGARGYVTKQEASTAVVSAVRAILAGEIYVSQSVMTNIIDRISEKKGRVELCGIETLADRELEVFQLIGSGHSIKEIAGQLHLGETTVDTYRARIKEKLGLRSAAEVYLKAGQWVKEQGLG